MAAEWFVRSADQEQGPISTQQLRQRAAAGEISADTPVRRGEDGKWMPAGRVKGLLSDSAAAAGDSVAAPEQRAAAGSRKYLIAGAIAGLVGIGVIVVLLTRGGAPSNQPQPTTMRVLPGTEGESSEDESSAPVAGLPSIRNRGSDEQTDGPAAVPAHDAPGANDGNPADPADAAAPPATTGPSAALPESLDADIERDEQGRLVYFDAESSEHVDDALVLKLAREAELRWLNLSGTSVTDEGVAALAELPALESLGLRATAVTDAAAAHAAKLPQLRELWLGETAVTDAGLQPLRDVSGSSESR